MTSSPRRLALAALLLVAFAGCRPNGESARAHVEGLRYRLLPGEARIITGRLVNDSDESITVAQIELSLFDGDNRRISSMQVVVQDIGAGESVEFREPVDSRLDVQGARVRRIYMP